MSSTPLTSEEKLLRLRNQITWVTRISTALGSTHNVEDLISIVLAALVSPTGLGYSKVLYFEYDPHRMTLNGKFALYHEDRESVEELARELAEETRFLEELADHEPEAERLLVEEQMHSLESSAPWIVLFQRMNPENEISRRLEKLQFSLSPPEGEMGEGNIFEQILYWRKPRVLCRSDVGDRLPAVLCGMLAEHFAIVPLFTLNGLRAVLFVDRHLEDDPRIAPHDVDELSYFARQAAVSIENGEMYDDLAEAYDELKQLDQMKSNFLSVVSHELRTPLTSMSGFVELLLEERVGSINENQRMLLTRVSKNTGHLIHLVNDLIEIAEVEVEGSVEVRLGPVEPLAVLMDTLPKLEQRRREKNVRVVPIVECDLPRILSDERALGRIFFHLLDNAIKFSPDESRVEVHFRMDDGECHIDVRDEGVGIAPENLTRIFSSFFQVDNTLTRGHEGLGLGLAVTNMLIKSTHGRIDVASELGSGSTFTVSYPISRRREETQA